jgi:hypothetical protein
MAKRPRVLDISAHQYVVIYALRPSRFGRSIDSESLSLSASGIGAAATERRMRPKILLFSPNPFALGERLRIRMQERSQVMEKTMQRRLIRYKTKPEFSDKNAELISAVFAELKATNPEGIRYLTLRLEDDTFIHLVETVAGDSSKLTTLPAFQTFQSGVRDRCAEPPLVRSVAIVGNYRMLGES